MKVSIIVAMADNRAIGKNNQLPWHLPADLKHFRLLTTGHHIIMGRKTYESIGKPLPKRTSIIISRNSSYPTPKGCLLASDLQHALKLAQKNGETEAFIIGGAQIYTAALAIASHIYLTQVHLEPEADTFFPALSNEWRVYTQEAYEPNDKNPCHYTFTLIKRIGL